MATVTRSSKCWYKSKVKNEWISWTIRGQQFVMGKTQSKETSTNGDAHVNVINGLEINNARHGAHEIKLRLILAMCSLQVLLKIYNWHQKIIRRKAFAKECKSQNTSECAWSMNVPDLCVLITKTIDWKPKNIAQVSRKATTSLRIMQTVFKIEKSQKSPPPLRYVYINQHTEVSGDYQTIVSESWIFFLDIYNKWA